ncbi:type IX secretion system sortase PorU [Sungkyunkwania multivorans]|uniref:Type IX secretion system sortase PorU n=1 Tax=Sungkyunkwania multivorans TaxID=1173618 RepID=A0ABW3D3W0_9FLAO
MKKTLLLLLVLGIHAFGISQTKHFDIAWQSPQPYPLINSEILLPTFQEENHDFDPNRGLQFVARWEVSSKVDPQSLVVKNIRFQEIDEAGLAEMPRTTIPAVTDFRLYSRNARSKIFNVLTLNPIIVDQGVYKRVVSFDISFRALENSPNAFSSRSVNTGRAITNSVLASGTWYQFYVEKSGVYRLDRNFLSNLGMNVSGIDPRNLKIYGNGGQMIALKNEDVLHYDPAENAIMVVGEEDGTFDGSDYVLFYAEGPDQWNDESQTHVNAFTNRTYYYITASGLSGKRIQEASQPTGVPDNIYTTFDDYQYYEKDSLNILQLGRRWFTNAFNINNTRTYSFDFPNRVVTEPITVSGKMAAASPVNTQFRISATDDLVVDYNIASVSNNDGFRQDPLTSTPNRLRLGLKSTQNVVTSLGDEIPVLIEYFNAGNPLSVGYMDYITVEAKRQLKGYGKQFNFQFNEMASLPGIGEVRLTDAANIGYVFDITDKYNVARYSNNNAASDFSFSLTQGSERKFIAVDLQDVYTPRIDAANRGVTNQSLKFTIFNDAAGFRDVDYIIVAPQFLSATAQRLADFHGRISNLNAKVVTLERIYREFNTGNPDIGAIRNFVKYVYDNASTPAGRIKYLCLFGDTSFDYKNRLQNNNNIVPTYHSYTSHNFLNGIMSDDFYAMMDPEEGLMENGQSDQDLMDLAVGRILASSTSEANDMVTKIEEYYSELSNGKWRNNITMVSDDIDVFGDRNIEGLLDQVSDEIANNKPFLNVKKIHSGSYQQETTAGGARYPQVNEDILNEIEFGSLVVNYFGHGGEDGLAQERIFQKPDALGLFNRFRYPLIVTVTCEFARFDNPLRPTVGEFTFSNKRGGAIGLITTTRLITVGAGIAFNRVLSRNLFRYNLSSPFDPFDYGAISESVMNTKNSVTSNKRVVFFVGDPAMKLAIPRPKINLTHVNDVPVTQPLDTLKALSYVKMRGNITDVNDVLLSNFNGEVFTSIFDKNIQRQTLGNDGVIVAGQLQILNYETLGEIIFRGKSSVQNGEFEFDFVVPKDIAIPAGNGKISFYALPEGGGSDYTGANIDDLVVGGLNENAANDDIGPTVRLFMNDESFISGEITSSSPILLALVEDENGINTASGIGHDIIAILDGDEGNPFVLNDYYETELDDYTKGRVSFPFRDLEPGLHTLSFRVWDVYNNSSTAEIQFFVASDDDIRLSRVLNYPNPFTSYTEFWFSHNQPIGETLDVQVQIFTVSGKVVKTINQQGIVASSPLIREITWDGLDDFGNRIGKGVYVYKITVKSTLTNKTAEKFEKLVIL